MNIIFDNSTHKIESAGVIGSPAPIRKITKGSMRSRFTIAEKVAIKVSSDPIVQVLAEDMNNSSHADLDYQELIDGLNYLQSVGIIAGGRVTELLVDGTQEESFY